MAATALTSTFGHVKNHYPNSDPGLVTAVLEATNKALQSLQKGEISRHFEMAQAITETLVEARGGAWHTMVGKSYGSFVSHENQQMVYISIGQIFIMTFKHG